MTIHLACQEQEYPPPDPAATATQAQVEANTALAMSAGAGGTQTKKPRTSYNYSTSTQAPMNIIYQDQIQMMQQKNSFFQGWNENEERSSTSSFTSIPNKCPQMQTMTAFPHQFQAFYLQLPTPRVHAQPQQQLGLGPWTWSHFHPQQPQIHEHEHPDDNLTDAASASLAVPFPHTSAATLAMQFGNEHYNYNIMSPRRSNQTPTPLLSNSKSNMDYLLPAAATEEMMLNGNAEGNEKEDEDIVGHPQSQPLPLYEDEDRDNGEVATGAVDVKRLGRHSSESSVEHEQIGVYPTNNDHTMRNHYRAFSPSPSHAQLELDLNLSQIPMSQFHPPQQQQQQQPQPQLYEHEHPDPDDNLLPAALAVPHSPVRHPFGNEFYTSPGRSTPTLATVYSNSKKDFPLPAVAAEEKEMKMKAKQEGGEGGIYDSLVFPNLSSIPNLPVSSAGASTNVSIHQNLWDLMFYELLEFKKQCGHCDVPQTYAPNPKLGLWVNKQRFEHKNRDDGLVSTLTEERLERLQHIGFRWAKRRGQVRWDEKYDELLQYKAKFGNCHVPTKFEENTALGRWVSTQRAEYKKDCKGEKSSMTAEKIHRLGSIGFAWCMSL